MTCRRTGARAARFAAGLLGVVLSVGLAGCLTTQTGGNDDLAGGSGPRRVLSPIHKRMQATYSDLASGVFRSLADFESPEQVSAFSVVGPDGATGERRQPVLSILRARNETGAGSLKVRLAAPDDRLVFTCPGDDSQPGARDWRPYPLLLQSVYGPPEGLTLELTVRSGDSLPLVWSRTLQVRPGWNLLRLDVQTIGDAIDLADVRSLSWRATELAEPTDFYLDDVILADNTKSLVAAGDTPDSLYALTRGQRIVVGVRDHFELAFADGVIVSWTGPGGVNLADTGGLGPWPVPLAVDWAVSPEAPVAYDDPRLFEAWGPAVATSQRIIEASPLRVVVEGRWRFVGGTTPADGPAGDVNALPGHTWIYAVYARGELHVSTASQAPDTGWGAPRVGYAVALGGRHEFKCMTPPPTAAHEQAQQFILAARAGRNQADLLWAWPQCDTIRQHRVLASVDERRLAIVAGDVEATPIVELAHVFRLWPADMDGVLEASVFTLDWQNPAVPTPTPGRVCADVAGDLSHDGYNESAGCYELELDDHVLRFDFDPRPYLRFDPVFRVHGTAGKRCWVYARGRLVHDVARDANDNLLFQLAHVVSMPTRIEVHAAPLDATP